MFWITAKNILQNHEILALGNLGKLWRHWLDPGVSVWDKKQKQWPNWASWPWILGVKRRGIGLESHLNFKNYIHSFKSGQFQIHQQANQEFPITRIRSIPAVNRIHLCMILGGTSQHCSYFKNYLMQSPSIWPDLVWTSFFIF